MQILKREKLSFLQKTCTYRKKVVLLQRKSKSNFMFNLLNLNLMKNKFTNNSMKIKSVRTYFRCH